jgi:hypothetical protein
MYRDAALIRQAAHGRGLLRQRLDHCLQFEPGRLLQEVYIKGGLRGVVALMATTKSSPAKAWIVLEGSSEKAAYMESALTNFHRDAICLRIAIWTLSSTPGMTLK